MGRPRIYTSDAERQRAFRARRRLKTADDNRHLAGPDTVNEGALAAIFDMFDEIWGAVPDEEISRLPLDGAEQHDHYIYGKPKRPR